LQLFPRHVTFTFTTPGLTPDHTWINFICEAEARHLDPLISALFFLIDTVKLRWSADKVVDELRLHVERFQRRRGESSVEFLSLSLVSMPPSPALPVVVEEREDSRAEAEVRRADPLVLPLPSSPLPPASHPNPCVDHWTYSGCRARVCPFTHQSYPITFLHHLERSNRLAWWCVPMHSTSFHPLLGLEYFRSSSSSSPSSLIVSLPVPIVWTRPGGAIVGPKGQIIRHVQSLCGVSSPHSFFYCDRGSKPAHRWSVFKARGSVAQIDSLIQALFFIIEHQHEGWSTDRAITELTAHVRAFQERRRRESNQDQFLSLRLVGASEADCSASSSSFASSARPIPLIPNSPLLSSSRPVPCMTNMGEVCPFGGCPYSHLPYVDLFVLCLDTHLTSPNPADIPNCTPTFHPILALVPSSSPPRYVVSFPLPRLPHTVAGLIGRGGSVIATLYRIAGVLRLSRLNRVEDKYEPGDEPIDWLTMSTVGEMEEVDVMMEGVLWLLEVGVHIDEMGREQGLEDHLHRFRRGRREALLMDGGEFYSLTSRQAPPLPASLPPSAASPLSSSSSAPFVSSSVSVEADSAPRAEKRSVDDLSSSGSIQTDLSSWYEEGRTVEYESAVLVPDFSSSCQRYIRSLPHTTFACLSIPADVKVREVMSTEPMDGVMKVSQIEDEHRVSVFVPAMKEEEMQDSDGGDHDDADQWLNVTVWKDSEEGSVDGGREMEMVEDAVRSLLARYEAVMRLVKPSSVSADHDQSQQRAVKRVKVS
jgi:hypothetical protein